MNNHILPTNCIQDELFQGFQFENLGKFPSTRYQGSKNKIIQWVDYHTRDIEFDSVIDAFGGTGSVGYMFKQRGKRVYYNDLLKFNYYIGLALIENDDVTLDDSDIDNILTRDKTIEYPSFIYDNFSNIYFTDEENRWLDITVTNIRNIGNKYKQALAYYALFQSCIIKRPYNLFHRKNLYIRNANIKRNFGNKKTWDTPFDYFFNKFAKEANLAVFSNGKHHKSSNKDIFNLNLKSDLVYIDTPYISKEGIGVDYFDFYHFLEGLVMYEKWNTLIDKASKHKKIMSDKNEWSSKDEILKAFEKLFNKFKQSKLVISYREDGIPSIDEIINLLEKYNKDIDVHKIDYKYVLSKKSSREVLIVAQ